MLRLGRPALPLVCLRFADLRLQGTFGHRIAHVCRCAAARAACAGQARRRDLLYMCVARSTAGSPASTTYHGHKPPPMPSPHTHHADGLRQWGTKCLCVHCLVGNSIKMSHSVVNQGHIDVVWIGFACIHGCPVFASVLDLQLRSGCLYVCLHRDSCAQWRPSHCCALHLRKNPSLTQTACCSNSTRSFPSLEPALLLCEAGWGAIVDSTISHTFCTC